MTGEPIRRPSLLEPPPSVVVHRPKVKPRELKCEWYPAIVSFPEHLKQYEVQRNMYMIILMILFFPSLFVVLPFLYPFNDLTIFLTLIGASCSILFVIVLVPFIVGGMRARDPLREQNTITYWKPMEVERKRLVFNEVLDVVGKWSSHEMMKANRFKGDLPEEIYKFDNDTYIAVKFRSAGRDWTGNGWIKIGYHFDHYGYARVLQRKVDEVLFLNGAAHQNMLGLIGK